MPPHSKLNIPDIPVKGAQILGLGIDIVASDRVRRMLASYGDRFLKRLFTESEYLYCMSRKEQVPELAVRLAAKEACFKAIGGRRGMGLGWRDFEVILDSEGVPAIKLRDHADERAKSMGLNHVWLSLTHEDEWSVAVVIMTA